MKPGNLRYSHTKAAPFLRLNQHQWLMVPLLAVTLLLLAACAPASTSAPNSNLPVATVLAQARQAMDVVQSYGISIDVGNSNFSGGKLARTAHGEWAAPNNYRIQFEKYGKNDVSTREIISVANQTLIIQSDGFQHEVDIGPQQSRDLQSLIPFYDPIIPELVQPVLQGESQVGGADVYHITGQQPPSEEAREPQVETGYSVTGYDLYIGKEDMLLRRLQISAEMSFPTPEGKATQTTVYNYFDYNVPVHIVLPPLDPCNRSKKPRRWLDCDRLSQRVYWLGEEVETPGAPSLELDGAWINYRNDDDVITEKSRLMVVYVGLGTTGGRGAIYLQQWSHPAWEEYIAQFGGYDPGTIPPGGPVNWWQHPCVDEEVYHEVNGAEVHLFKAHLPSLTRIYPMSPEDVSQCLQEPVGAVGAHVYFPETVVAFSVQDSFSPAGPPATTQALPPGATPSTETPQSYPEWVLHDRNPYNSTEAVRIIAAALKPIYGD